LSSAHRGADRLGRAGVAAGWLVGEQRAPVDADHQVIITVHRKISPDNGCITTTRQELTCCVFLNRTTTPPKVGDSVTATEVRVHASQGTYKALVIYPPDATYPHPVGQEGPRLHVGGRLRRKADGGR
jgi:hypothetical protein